MRHTENIGRSAASSKTGLVALLDAFSRVKGSGVSKISQGGGAPARRMISPVLLMTLAALIFMTTPALAAAPSVISESVSGVKAAEAHLEAHVNPNSEPTECHFQYGTTSVTENEVQCEQPLIEGGEQGVGVTVPSLAQHTVYHYRVVLKNLKGEEAKGSAEPFETAIPPEKPTTKSPAASIAATTATLEGTLNPVKAGEAGTYQVYYQQSATECNPEHVAPETAGAMSGAAKQGVSVPVTGLEPNTEYAFCVVAINKAGEVAIGNAVPFKTLVSKPTVINESAEPKAEEVRLNATVNASNEATECHFQYGTASVGEHVVPCEQATIEGGEQPVDVTATGLKQNTVYKYQVLLKNATGAEKGTEEEFKTDIHPETPTDLKAEPVTTTTATLHGVLNPGATGNPGSYEFLYRQSPKECQGEGGQSIGGSALGGKEEAVKTEPELENLLPNTTYTYCLRAHNEVGEEATSAPVTFTTLVAPLEIKSESSTVVSATEARLEAEIYDGNSETTYHFEYGPAAGDYTVSIPVPAGQIAAHLTGVGVSAVATGLEPGATYHWRVVAANALPGEVDGVDQSFTTPAAQGSGSPQSCPNEKLRTEQPYGLELPDCRAYEMVSPVDTEGQDATDSFVDSVPRASVSGDAVTYAAAGNFAGPTGGAYEDQFVSKRGPESWSTQAIAPLQDAVEGNTIPAYLGTAFTPELTEGVATSDDSLTGEGPPGNNFGLFVDDFANDSYRYIGIGTEPLGVSTDLSHVVSGGHGTFGGEAVSEWVNGTSLPVSLTDNGEYINYASFAGWHALSANGSRVYLASEGQLYARVNAEQPPSPIASPETFVTGTLTEGSNLVTAVAPVTVGENIQATITAGSTRVTFYPSLTHGSLAVGEGISGPGIPAGTTITASFPNYVTMSAPATATNTATITTYHPSSFAVGQRIEGDGISAGTTITNVGSEELTLSTPAAFSDSGVRLHAGGECTVPADACTVLVSAQQRLKENPAGTQEATYWGASAEGEKVFFTSKAELTSDAYTGPSGQGANLYEYELSGEPGKLGRLTDLTGEKLDDTGDGAAVQGVVQISESGSYVYFVAKGALATGASEQQCRAETKEEETGAEPKQDNLGCNLYLSHDGETKFIATVSVEDAPVDWQLGPGLGEATVTPDGTRLAFISERSLTGYDNEQAEPSECETTGAGNDVGRETGKCREVYLYDAETSGLTCASCNPSGARPVGPSKLSAPYSNDYRPRDLLENRTLFFDSSDALVPHASDGRENVYEYENGHVYPISDVAGGSQSFFMDASPDGDDVFFGSADQLLPQDQSNNVVVYDARVEGGFPVTVAAPPCTTAEACRTASAPTPGVYGPPASATFSGPGNLASPPPAVVKKVTKKTVKCAKGKKLSHGKCIKKKKPKKAKKAKRATNDRRASR